jgi:hypothetical protein
MTQLLSSAVLVLAQVFIVAPAFGDELPWSSPCKYRLLLDVDVDADVDPRAHDRSNSPASVDVDFVKLLSDRGIAGRIDQRTIEVMAYDDFGSRAVFDKSRAGYERYLQPWRLDAFYGIDRETLNFVLPSERHTRCVVYFDTVESGLGRSNRYPGLVGDGDFFRQEYGRREIGASHFDCFADLDGDGDLDLFKGGVEPFIYCYENVGGNRMEYGGRLTSGGELFELPNNPTNHRSWVLPHFHDIDRDGDLDFFPSFMDGPRAGRIVFYENTTSDGLLTLIDRGVLQTVSGVPVAGGEQAGGWFPSIVFVEDFDGDQDGRTDVLVGNNNHCYLYRDLGADEGNGGDGGWRLADAIALQAGGVEIEMYNACYEMADVDADGDRDLFGAPQAGALLFYENIDESPGKTRPTFARGEVILEDGVFTLTSGHPRITAADFTGDGLLDLVVDRAWELTNTAAVAEALRGARHSRDFGALFENVGTPVKPVWQRRDAHRGAPFTEEFQICDALRQNVVRAIDWNDDGVTDLIAGDCDGFVWYFQNQTNNHLPLFASGQRLAAGKRTLSVADSGGHARPDVCDWNNDGKKDLVVSDGAGTVTVYLNESSTEMPVLSEGKRVMQKNPQGSLGPIDRGTRSHLMVCDWNSDGKKDLVFSDQENPGFYFLQNTGTDAEPLFAPARDLGLTGYVRPNLGSFVDWDGDGVKDLVACEFEHSIRLYRNTGPDRPGAEPSFAEKDGIHLIKPYSIMMISGVDVVDWNGDGDLDILTGQGHGGNGLRFYERDYIEDSINGTHPIVCVGDFEVAASIFLETILRYADTMIAKGRDTYGDHKSGLFLSALDRTTLTPLEIRPAPPAGVRRGDRVGLPWRKLTGANPQLDQNLLRLLFTLSEITSEPRYREAADQELKWFFENTQSPVTGLMPWGEHLSWDVMLDRAISSGTDLSHEFARPWVLWDRSFELAREPCIRFAQGLWNHQIANHKTGAFDRHASFDRHGPRDGRDYPRHGAFYIHTWAHAYKYR